MCIFCVTFLKSKLLLEPENTFPIQINLKETFILRVHGTSGEFIETMALLEPIQIPGGMFKDSTTKTTQRSP